MLDLQRLYVVFIGLLISGYFPIQNVICDEIQVYMMIWYNYGTFI